MKTLSQLKEQWQRHNQKDGLSWNEVGQLVEDVAKLAISEAVTEGEIEHIEVEFMHEFAYHHQDDKGNHPILPQYSADDIRAWLKLKLSSLLPSPEVQQGNRVREEEIERISIIVIKQQPRDFQEGYSESAVYRMLRNALSLLPSHEVHQGVSEKLINSLKNQMNIAEKDDYEPMDDANWNAQYEVIVTVNQAKEIVEALTDSDNQQKEPVQQEGEIDEVVNKLYPMRYPQVAPDCTGGARTIGTENYHISANREAAKNGIKAFLKAHASPSQDEVDIQEIVAQAHMAGQMYNGCKHPSYGDAVGYYVNEVKSTMKKGGQG